MNIADFAWWAYILASLGVGIVTLLISSIAADNDNWFGVVISWAFAAISMVLLVIGSAPSHRWTIASGTKA